MHMTREVMPCERLSMSRNRTTAEPPQGEWRAQRRASGGALLSGVVVRWRLRSGSVLLTRGRAPAREGAHTSTPSLHASRSSALSRRTTALACSSELREAPFRFPVARAQASSSRTCRSQRSLLSTTPCTATSVRSLSRRSAASRQSAAMSPYVRRAQHSLTLLRATRPLQAGS